MATSKLFQSVSCNNYSDTLSGKVLFCISTPAFFLFVQVSKAGQNIIASQITEKDFNSFKDYETCDCVKCLFDISLDDVLEMAQDVCVGADIQELVAEYEDLTNQEIAAAENDSIAQNEYWVNQHSLSWS